MEQCSFRFLVHSEAAWEVAEEGEEEEKLSSRPVQLLKSAGFASESF